MNLYRVSLRQFSFLVTFLIALTLTAQDNGDTAPKKNKSTLSADIYEKEDSSSSFTAAVKLIRETDVIEVFFDSPKNKGPYLLKDSPNLGVFKERLSKSQKNKGQTVIVNLADDVITNVELTEKKAAEEKKKSDLDSVLDDMLKK